MIRVNQPKFFIDNIVTPVWQIDYFWLLVINTCRCVRSPDLSPPAITKET